MSPLKGASQHTDDYLMHCHDPKQTTLAGFVAEVTPLMKNETKTESGYRPLLKYHIWGILLGIAFGCLFGFFIGGDGGILAGALVFGFVGEFVGLVIGRART
jgi:hypothetical protein